MIWNGIELPKQYCKIWQNKVVTYNLFFFLLRKGINSYLDLYWTIPGSMAVVYTYVGILTVDVVFFRSPGIFHSQDSFPSTFRPRLWETSSGVDCPTAWSSVKVPPEDASHRTKRQGEGILGMKDAGTSEEDDIDIQDSNIPIDHGHLDRNCSIKIITPAVKALVISEVTKIIGDGCHPLKYERLIAYLCYCYGIWLILLYLFSFTYCVIFKSFVPIEWKKRSEGLNFILPGKSVICNSNVLPIFFVSIWDS